MSDRPPKIEGEARNERFWSRIEDSYLALDSPSIQESFARHMEYSQAKTRYTATPKDCFQAAALAVRDRLMERWNDTQQAYHQANPKRVYYLSLEFLLGRAWSNALLNLGMTDAMRAALAEFGYSFDDLAQLEADAGLGNGGLGRLAACYLDSMASLQLPGYGYGIRYDWGIFEQRIVEGRQVERPDSWLRAGCPWEVMRPEYQYPVRFGGEVRAWEDSQGRLHHEWRGGSRIVALAYDLPVPGYRNDTVNTLRLWSARADCEFDLELFQRGDYLRAMEDKVLSETVSSVLYPKDDMPPGKELRLKQEYFFVSATLQDILRRHKADNSDLHNLADKVAIQLNDTHPALAVPELLRLLLDEEGLDWDEAWALCQGCCAYTNHTVLPEALETWSVELFGALLPRHLELVYEINRRFLEDVREAFPADLDAPRRMSLIQEEPVRAVRMAHLAVVGSHCVNGVSALHGELVRSRLFPDFVRRWPERFTSVTNGITPRRWLALANPELAALVDSALGPQWRSSLEQLAALRPLARDSSFCERFAQVKRRNKERLCGLLRSRWGFAVDPAALFDCQAKRIHEYKRQLLNLLHVLTLYQRIREGRGPQIVPRVFLFAGKAAPGYVAAKRIIRLVHAVAEAIRRHPEAARLLQVVFLPNYDVSLAQHLIPAAELSEQISTAGLEASGTGNMKFALNGALTLGTLDGANIEMLEHVGAENFFAFGHDAEQIAGLRQQGYSPFSVYQGDAELRGVLDLLASGELSPHEPDLFQGLLGSLLQGGDPFFVLADYRAYVERQAEVAAAYCDPSRWWPMAVANTAGMGFFSSDRSVQEYAERIWGTGPVPPVQRTDRWFIAG